MTRDWKEQMSVKIRLGDRVPVKGPAAYIVRSGKGISHIGDSSSINERIGALARLGKHYGGAEVLCVAWCTGEWPSVEIEPFPTYDEAHVRAEELKKRILGEPPVPAEFSGCKNGALLRAKLVKEAGVKTYKAGYIDAVFDLGEPLKPLFADLFDGTWAKVGKPPGPWCEK